MTDTNLKELILASTVKQVSYILILGHVYIQPLCIRSFSKTFRCFVTMSHVNPAVVPKTEVNPKKY